jgi:cell wall-associated NlpC family hydrolase
VSNDNLGRHRAPGRLNPASSLSAAISRAAKPASKASAVIAISGGMAASFALPASAAIVTTETKTKAPATPTAILTPSAAPAQPVSRTFGKIGFKGVDKPRPVAVPMGQRTIDRVSRSATREPVSRSATREPVSRVSTNTQKTPVETLAPSSGGLLDVAAGLAGIDYVYGGTTTAGFDCSGFTQYVFGKRGIGLPRTAEAQRQAATPVSDPQPGDLVFMGSPAHHVGIYAGNGMMWDSPQTGGAVSKRSVYSSSATFGRV